MKRVIFTILLASFSLISCIDDSYKRERENKIFYSNYEFGRVVEVEAGRATFRNLVGTSLSGGEMKSAVRNVKENGKSCLIIGDPVENLSNETLAFADVRGMSDGQSFQCGGKSFSVRDCRMVRSRCAIGTVYVGHNGQVEPDYKYVFSQCRGVVSYYPSTNSESAFILVGRRGLFSNEEACSSEVDRF